MNLGNPTDNKKAADLLFREEIVCDLIGNQHLTTRINFSIPDADSMLRCQAEMHFEELDLTVHLQHPLHATESREVMDCRTALGELLIDKMLAELQTAQIHFSNLDLFSFDGTVPVQQEQISPGSPKPNAAGGYLPASIHHRSTGGYLPSAPRNAGGYLPSAAHSKGRPDTLANNQLAAGSGIPFKQATISTNYSSIEQHAARLLHLKEAIRGMFNLQNQRHWQ
jgi:hypothetical protein